MTKVYRTFAKVSSPCLFDYQTRKEALEVNGSPLAKLFDAFNFEKYRLDIVDCGICQASFPEISQKNRYQLSSSRDVVPDPRIFVYQSRSIDRPRNVLSCSHGTGRDPDDRYHSRSPRIRAGRSFLIHLLLFNRFRWLLRI